jgi:hypothetical protein
MSNEPVEPESVELDPRGPNRFEPTIHPVFPGQDPFPRHPGEPGRD